MKKSVEKDTRRKADSPHPGGRVDRVTRDEHTDRDSDDSDREVRELKKELMAVKENQKRLKINWIGSLREQGR